MGRGHRAGRKGLTKTVSGVPPSLSTDTGAGQGRPALANASSERDSFRPASSCAPSRASLSGPIWGPAGFGVGQMGSQTALQPFCPFWSTLGTSSKIGKTVPEEGSRLTTIHGVPPTRTGLELRLNCHVNTVNAKSQINKQIAQKKRTGRELKFEQGIPFSIRPLPISPILDAPKT